VFPDNDSPGYPQYDPDHRRTVRALWQADPPPSILRSSSRQVEPASIVSYIFISYNCFIQAFSSKESSYTECPCLVILRALELGNSDFIGSRHPVYASNSLGSTIVAKFRFISSRSEPESRSIFSNSASSLIVLLLQLVVVLQNNASVLIACYPENQHDPLDSKGQVPKHTNPGQTIPYK